MKYKIKMSCGHVQEVELYGHPEYIEDKIKFMQKRSVCGKCYMKKQLQKNLAAGYVEVRVPYRDYKLRYSNLPYIPGSYNVADMTILVCMPPKIAARAIERETKKEQERLEREEKKRVQEQQKAERAAARAAILAAAKAAKQKKEELPKPAKPAVPEPPLNLRPPEATLFLKTLATEFNRKYRVASTELAKQDVRCAYSRLNLFYSSYGKKDWEKLVANNDIVNLPATKIVQLAQHYYDNTPKDRLGCVRRY